MNTSTKVALLAVMLTTLVAGTQLASADDHTTEDKEAHKAIHQEVKAAFEAGDFTAYETAVADTKKAGLITEAQFQTILEARELKDAGDKEAAKALLEEAGIERPFHKHRGGGNKNPEARAAVEAGNYAAFQTAVADGKRADITQDQFNVLVEANSLREAGDKEGARELLKEAGFERQSKGKRGQSQE